MINFLLKEIKKKNTKITCTSIFLVEDLKITKWENVQPFISSYMLFLLSAIAYTLGNL